MFIDDIEEDDPFKEIVVEALLEALADDATDVAGFYSEMRRLKYSKGQIKQILIRNDLFDAEAWSHV